MKKIIYILLFIINTSVITQNQDWVYRNPLPQNDFNAIKFFDQNTGYVCGSKGAILKTYTGNNQWVNLSINSLRNLNSMYFFDANNGFIAGDSGLIIRTTNGGINWIRVVSGLTNALRSITFVNSNTGFIAGDNGVILKSTTGGTTWLVINNNSRNLRNIYFLDANTGFAVGDSGLFMKTTNSGGSWSVQTLGIIYPGITLNCISFCNPQKGFIVTAIGYFYKTTDCGNNWTDAMLGGWNNLKIIKFINQYTGYAVGKYFLRSIDSGAYWSPYHIGGVNYFVNDISITDTNIFLACSGGYIFKTGVGLSIYNFKNIGGSKHNFSSISFVNENTGFMVSQDQYWRTSNGGLNWSNDGLINNGYDGAGPQSNYNSVSFFTQSSGYQIIHTLNPTMYSQEYLYNSTDGGITWAGPKYFTQTATLIKDVFETEGVTYIINGNIGYGGRILKNSGSGWLEVFNSSPITPSSISFSNQNTGISIYNYPNRGYLKTSNGGSNWSVNSFPETKMLNDVQLLASGTGFIIGDSALIRRTTDFGNAWNILPQSVMTNFINLQFIDNNTGWIIGSISYSNPSHYRLFYTSNSGTNLIQIISLDSFDVKGMSFINMLTGYVCGDSGVVLKTTNGGLTFVDPVSSNTPNGFQLMQNYPNPFNPSTKIKFSLPSPSKGGAMDVNLVIYDVLGRKIANLIPPLRGGKEGLSSGTYEVEWDGTNYPSGVYFYKLTTADFSETKKMVLIK